VYDDALLFEISLFRDASLKREAKVKWPGKRKREKRRIDNLPSIV